MKKPKCLYYVSKNLQLMAGCGVEGDYDYDRYCTYCGKKIKEVKGEAPDVLYRDDV